MARRKLKKEYRTVMFIVAGALCAAAVWGATYIYGHYDYRFGEAVIKSGSVKIYPEQTSIQSVGDMLQSAAIIKSSDEFQTIAKSRGVSAVEPGAYSFQSGDSFRTVVATLANGRETPVRVTFNNIRTLEQLAGVLGKSLMADSLEFINYFNAKNSDSKYIEHFIPNSYDIYWSISPERFAERMEDEFKRFWQSDNRAVKAKKLGFTPSEIVTIASIVDEETNVVDEMDEVAGVYINRLRKGIALQADPTVKYAIGDFSIKRVLNKHLTYDSPYNTYKYSGLPPGPICSPSIAAIDATLNYDGHNYLYFCANADFSGRHAFARTLSEHNANARKYQAELNRRGIR